MFHLLVKCVEIVQGVDTSQNEGNLQGPKLMHSYFNDSQDEPKDGKKGIPYHPRILHVIFAT